MFRSDQIRSVTQSCPTLCDPMNRSTPRLPVHHQLPEFTETHVHRVSDAIQPSHPLSSTSPPAPNPSQHQVFSNESTLRMRWPKYWSFSFSISPSKEHPGLISFRRDWFGLLAVQGTLKSLLQHHSSKASILWRSAVTYAIIRNTLSSIFWAGPLAWEMSSTQICGRLPSNSSALLHAKSILLKNISNIFFQQGILLHLSFEAYLDLLTSFLLSWWLQIDSPNDSSIHLVQILMILYIQWEIA